MRKKNDAAALADVVAGVADDLHLGAGDVGDGLAGVRVAKEDDGADLGHGGGIEVVGGVVDDHGALGETADDDFAAGAFLDCLSDLVGPVLSSMISTVLVMPGTNQLTWLAPRL